MQNAEHRAIEEHQTNEHTVKHTPSNLIIPTPTQSGRKAFFKTLRI